MNTSKISPRCFKNCSNRTHYMLPVSICVLKRSREIKDIRDALKSQSRMQIQTQEEPNKVSERASSGLLEDGAKMTEKQGFKKSYPIDADSVVAPSKKRVYPFEILIRIGGEVSKKQRLTKELEMEKHQNHAKGIAASNKTEVTPVVIAASNKTNKEDSWTSEEAKLKMQREKDRETARIALEKMERTTVFNDNLKGLKELELLANGCSFNVFQTLGLVLKRDEYTEKDEEEDQKLHRVEMLKRRFANTIEKAEQTVKAKQPAVKAEVSSVTAVAASRKLPEPYSRKKHEEAKLKTQHKKLKIQQGKHTETARTAVRNITWKKNKISASIMSIAQDMEEGEIVC